MSVAESEKANEPAMLTVGDRSPMEITSEASLTAELSRIVSLNNGQVVILQRHPKHYIKATRIGCFWSMSFRNGPIWTLNGFSADGTTEYSDRKVKESRNAGSLLDRIKVALTSPAPANALSNEQVEGLFRAYLLGTKFPIAPGIG